MQIKQRSWGLLVIGVALCAISCWTMAGTKLPVWTTQKQAFVDKILMNVELVNEQVRDQRQQLSAFYHRFHQQQSLTSRQQRWVKSLASWYRLKTFNIAQERSWQALVKRVDIVPPSLALAQAITESAWGRSRFATQGNNYYGVWCYRRGCGLVPKRRARGARFELRRYPSVKASVLSYVRNLNSNRAYRLLRELRYQARQKGLEPTGVDLAQGLVHYSTQRQQYVRSLQSIIRFYELSAYDHLHYSKVT